MYYFNNFSGTKNQRRILRKNPTSSESLLWEQLRDKNVGYKFRRQHSIHKYIVDFYCASLLLAIEVDGNVHDSVIQKNHDTIRDEYFKELFITTIRFKNEEIEKDIHVVVQRIKDECVRQKKRLAGITSMKVDDTLPCEGEG